MSGFFLFFFPVFLFLKQRHGRPFVINKVLLAEQCISWRICLVFVFVPFLGGLELLIPVISGAVAIIFHKTTDLLCGLARHGRYLQSWAAGARNVAWLWRRAGISCMGPLEQHNLCMCTPLEPENWQKMGTCPEPQPFTNQLHLYTWKGEQR